MRGVTSFTKGFIMAVEKRAASMIKRLQRELKGTRSNLTTKRNRIKAQIASLRAESQKAQAKRAHAARGTATKRAKPSKKAPSTPRRTQIQPGGAAGSYSERYKKPTPARKTITRMSPSRGGTVPMKGIRTRRPKPSSFDRGRSSSPVFNINK